jgi:ribosomal 30S subunit maturation factor RimM
VPLLLFTGNVSEEDVRSEDVNARDGILLSSFGDIDCRQDHSQEQQNSAQCQVTCRLMIRADERPELEDEDEFYSTDLIGMEVVLSDEGHTRDGIILGTVVDLHDGTGTYDVLRIEFDPDIVLDKSNDMLVTIAELAQQVGTLLDKILHCKVVPIM